MALSPYETYQEQSVSTLTPGELIVLLYDRVVFNLNAAVRDIGKKKPGDAHRHIRKAQDIVFYLRGILNPELSVSQSLNDYYTVLARQLSRANLKKDAAALEDAILAMRSLRGIWVNIETQNRKNSALGSNMS